MIGISISFSIQSRDRKFLLLESKTLPKTLPSGPSLPSCRVLENRTDLSSRRRHFGIQNVANEPWIGGEERETGHEDSSGEMNNPSDQEKIVITVSSGMSSGNIERMEGFISIEPLFKFSWSAQRIRSPQVVPESLSVSVDFRLSESHPIHPWVIYPETEFSGQLESCSLCPCHDFPKDPG